MLFKTAAIEQQYPRLHLELRKVLTELEVQNELWELPKLVITEAFRTPAEQEEIYWRSMLKRKDVTGKMVPVPEREARMLARRKFTFHFVGAAVDLRAHDPDRALAWLQGRLWNVRAGHELLIHDVGTGKHLHVAVRDVEGRKKYEADTA